MYRPDERLKHDARSNGLVFTLTDTAFGLLRRTEESFAGSSGQPTHDAELWGYLGLNTMTRGNIIWLCHDPPVKKLRHIDSNTNVVDLLCPLASVCIRDYLYDARLLCDMGKFAKDTTMIDQDALLSGRHISAVHPFRQLLRQLAPAIHDIAHSSTCQHVVIDEFVQGLADAHQYNRLPIWLVVACQIYLDAYDVLQTGVESGVDVLQKFRNQVRQTNKDVEVLLTDLAGLEASFHQAYTDLHSLAAGTNRVECSHHTNAASTSQDIVPKEGCTCLRGETPASDMERLLPGHTGALLADAKIGMHYIGCRIANHGLYVLCMAHLYKSLRSRGLLMSDWHDMMFLLAGYSQKDALVPKSDAEYDAQSAKRHFLLALGVPLSHFAAKRRHPGANNVPQLKEARKVQVTSQYLRSMSTNDENREGTWDEHGSGWSKAAAVERVLYAMSMINTKGTNGGRSQHSATQVSFTPVQLLQTYRRSILADEPQLNFDYVQFTLTCRKLLHAMVLSVGERLNMPPPQQPLDHLDMVSALLASDLIDANVLDAAAAVNAYLADSSKMFVKQAYDQSSGRIPKHLRPSFTDRQEKKSMMLDLACAVLDKSDAKYVVSNTTIAAYHPQVKIERCVNPDCDNSGCARDDAETDPAAKNHGPRILVLGSALPPVVVQEAIAGIRKDPKAYLAARDRLVDDFCPVLKQLIDGVDNSLSMEALKDVFQQNGWSWNAWAGDEDLKAKVSLRARLTEMTNRCGGKHDGTTSRTIDILEIATEWQVIKSELVIPFGSVMRRRHGRRDARSYQHLHYMGASVH
ncbi:hypothetical protein LTR86_009779 [Recurvomyces mirabilis]|nr:hypothetical protein LTR86_009779 [Recurvomyces mirabilis]